MNPLLTIVEARVLGALVQGVPVGRRLAEALDRPWHAGVAQPPDGRFDLAVPS